MTLAQQKSEKVPRMSGEELLALLGVDGEIRRRKNRFDSRSALYIHIPW